MTSSQISSNELNKVLANLTPEQIAKGLKGANITGKSSSTTQSDLDGYNLKINSAGKLSGLRTEVSSFTDNMTILSATVHSTPVKKIEQTKSCLRTENLHTFQIRTCTLCQGFI